ncbi:pitrilysin family protein [Prevotella sp. HUN102]|uniref:M16 family metallopeptidase n=1 Tax=Prevotella sp. HUN102 TaxID=1392486 RepID=UPI0009DFB6D7|nr:insulinase family protein [Prevotella sp. HUN102]
MIKTLLKNTFAKRIQHGGLLIAALLLFCPFTAKAQNVQQDKSFRTGKLENGLTYYIRHNAKEAGIADFYIAQRVGSILEEPRQRGLAHFLEHMAFNGTKHFTGKGSSPNIVPWCESIGVKFGSNLNAYTSVEQTVYNISSVPVKRESIIDSTLLILHDWSHFLLLTDEEIDKERGVIHEEWRTRRAGMAVQRMMERVLPTVYKGTKYEDCLPIGSMDIVDNFPYKDLRDYYQKWYRPDLQAIIIVGDIDVDRIEAKIKQTFSDIPKPINPAERIYYPVNDNDKMIVAIDKDSEQPIMLANLYMKHDATPDNEKNTVMYQRDNYVSRLIVYMLNSHLNDIKKQANPPFHSASISSGKFLVSRTKEAFSVSFGCLQENVKKSFDAAIAETERARRYGFTIGELERAKAQQLKTAERRFAERNDRRNSYFVRAALNHFIENEPMTTAEYDLELIRKFSAEITLEEVNAATKELISNKNQVLTVYAPDKTDFPIADEATFEKYVLDAQAKNYAPYKEETIAKELIAKLPKKGKIKSESDWDKFGVKKIVLSNGVEVYVKTTDFAKDQITMRFYGEGGQSLYPDADAINFQLLSTAINEAGVGEFTNTQLEKMLSARIVRIAPSIGQETQSINGSSSVKDLKTLMELTYLYFTSPRKDAEKFTGSVNTMRSFLTNREANPQVSYNDSVMAIVYGNHPRLQPLKAERLNQVSYERIFQIYKERFSDASGFKMVLVGNINLEELRPLLCQYVASLPAKGKIETFRNTYPQVRNVNETHIFKKKMNTPSTLVNIFYTFDEPYTAQNDLALDVFKRVLSIAYTDSVREEKGGTYGVGVQTSFDKNSSPTSLVKINFRTDPAKYEMLIPIIYRQIEHIAENGPLESSMDKVKKYLLKAYRQSIVNNGYWESIIYNRLRTGIDLHTDYEGLVNRLTSADVQQIAKDLLQSNRRIEITMMSE